VYILRDTDPLRKDDVLASNLLFATLLLWLGEQLVNVGLRVWFFPSEPDPLWPGSAIWLLAVLLLKAPFYLAIRHGMFRAKVVVLVVCAYIAYSGTHPHYGYFAGINVGNFWGWPLLVVLKNLLTLAALVLMFKKPQVVAPSTSWRALY
jgi:hypothetical protein